MKIEIQKKVVATRPSIYERMLEILSEEAEKAFLQNKLEFNYIN